MFKNHSLLFLMPLALLATSALAEPTKKSVAKLPISVAATMPTLVLDIATYQIAPAPGEPKILVHLWCAPRRNPNGGGTFGSPAGAYQGAITREEVDGSRGLRPSPFVYDIFTADGKGGWQYRNSISRFDTATPGVPTVRYLNNRTKQGIIFEIDQFGGQYVRQRTLYTFTDWDSSPIERDISNISPPAPTGAVRTGFGRDARGYATLITSEDSRDEATGKVFETRTIFRWDEQTRDWKMGRPVVSERK